MNQKQRLLSLLARRRSVNPHLRALVDSGDVVRTRVSRAARYSLAERAPPAASPARSFDLEKLEEEVVWEQFAARLNLRSALRANVEAVTHYAFTEMLNNAIEHSGTRRCHVSVSLEPRQGRRVRVRRA